MLRKIWNSWRRFGQWMGDRVARAVLLVLYLTVALPFGLLIRLTQDPLDTRSLNGGWVDRASEDPSLDDAGRLF